MIHNQLMTNSTNWPGLMTYLQAAVVIENTKFPNHDIAACINTANQAVQSEVMGKALKNWFAGLNSDGHYEEQYHSMWM